MAGRRDPLPRLRRYLVGQGILTSEAAEAMEIEVRVEIDDAARRAEAAPAPRPETAFRRVYARPLRRTPGVPPDLDEGPERPAVAPPRPAGGVERTVLDTVRQTLHDLMAEDERVVVLGEDVGVLGGVFRATDGIYAAFGPKRVIDTPLAESSIVGIGVGLALAGLRPVVEIQFADFMHAAFDQLVSEAAKIHYRSNGDFHVPMVVRAPWGGGGHRGPYHSQSIEAFFAHVAGLKVVCPSTPADVAGMLRSAVEDPTPCCSWSTRRPTGASLAWCRTATGGCPSAWPRWSRPGRISRWSPMACTATSRCRRSMSSTRRATRWRSSTCAPSHPWTGTPSWDRSLGRAGYSSCTRTT